MAAQAGDVTVPFPAWPVHELAAGLFLIFLGHVFSGARAMNTANPSFAEVEAKALQQIRDLKAANAGLVADKAALQDQLAQAAADKAALQEMLDKQVIATTDDTAANSALAAELGLAPAGAPVDPAASDVGGSNVSAGAAVQFIPVS